MVHLSDVTACLVTRGDQPEMMERILSSLVFDSVIVWDNSQREDRKCAGRYWANAEASTPFVYFQDDDVVVPEATQQFLAGWHSDGDVCTANWGHGENPAGYDDLPLVCGGAIVDAAEPWRAIKRYAQHFPLDEAFNYEADFIVGALYPKFTHVHLPFHIEMPVAQDPSRLVNQPWQRGLKAEMTARARAIRDGKLDGFAPAATDDRSVRDDSSRV